MDTRFRVSLLWLLFIITFSFGVNPTVALDEAPDFTLVDIYGEQFELSSHIGRIVLIDFFATWCGPCKSEIEHLRGLFDAYPQDQLIIISVGVDLQETSNDLKNFAQQYGIEWTVARDIDHASDKYGVSFIPHLVIIDAEGYRQHDHIGLTGESTLRREIDSLLFGSGNGESNGNSEPPYMLIAVIGGAVIGSLVIAIVVAGVMLGWSKTSKARLTQEQALTKRLQISSSFVNYKCVVTEILLG